MHGTYVLLFSSHLSSTVTYGIISKAFDTLPKSKMPLKLQHHEQH